MTRPAPLGAVPFLVATLALAAPAPEELAARARSLAGNLQLSLQGELFAAMKAGGPPQALDVCKTRAPEIALETSRGTDWRIARTALRVRNPKNAPDAWERKVMEEWTKRVAKGEAPATLETWEVAEADGKKTFRYMKAIPTGSPCLACHGAELKPEIAAKVKELYPEDQATGFASGELRGAFTLSKPIE